MASFTKLRSGEWGVKVKGRVGVGQRVTVQTRGGETKTVTNAMRATARQLWAGGKALCHTCDAELPDFDSCYCDRCDREQHERELAEYIRVHGRPPMGD